MIRQAIVARFKLLCLSGEAVQASTCSFSYLTSASRLYNKRRERCNSQECEWLAVQKFHTLPTPNGYKEVENLLRIEGLTKERGTSNGLVQKPVSRRCLWEEPT